MSEPRHRSDMWKWQIAMLGHSRSDRATEEYRGRRRSTWCLLTAIVLLALFAATGPVAAQADNAFADRQLVAQLAHDLPGNITDNPRDPEFWRNVRRGSRGLTTLPDRKSDALIQSSGQRWRIFREQSLPRYGIWGLSGICVILALFFMIRGPILIETGYSGSSILRFCSIERFAHWLLALSFLVLAVTGLNILYGSDTIKPLIGHVAFAKVTAYGKWLHDFTGYAFIAGLMLILLVWIRDNIPNRDDLHWLARAGGLFSRGVHPPAHRFNAGQKIIFWFVILAGASMSFSGICLLFPFTFSPFAETFAVINLFGLRLPTDLSPLQEMQLTHAWHAVLGIFMIVVIIAHIYLASVGMEGAFDGMASGYVDENWAREHHALWMAELNTEPSSDGVERPETPTHDDAPV